MTQKALSTLVHNMGILPFELLITGLRHFLFYIKNDNYLEIRKKDGKIAPW